nr:DUF695 domain-containing protein [uncultured Flavobacterium sp.]
MEALKHLITDKDTWTLSEGEIEGYPFLIRFRPHLQSFADTKNYNKRLVIIWTYESNDDSLMPNQSDIELMEDVENGLVEILEIDIQAILAFVYTGENQKEWHWYSNDIKLTGQRLNEALSNFERLPIELLMEDDENWNEYNLVLEGANETNSEE